MPSLQKIILTSVLATGWALASCGITDSCDEETSVHESIYIDGEEFFGEDVWEVNGWDCRFDGSIRDALGRLLGNRYVCTRCT